MVATAIHGEQVLAREKNMVSANFSPRTRRPRWPHARLDVVIPRNRGQQRMASDVPFTAPKKEGGKVR